jgi:hypothetical protein
VQAHQHQRGGEYEDQGCERNGVRSLGDVRGRTGPFTPLALALSLVILVRRRHLADVDLDVAVPVAA